MKEKIVKVLLNPFFQGVLSLIITFLILFQEIKLGTEVSPWWGIVIALVIGLFAELCRYIAKLDKYNILRVIPWLVGGIIGCALTYLI